MDRNDEQNSRAGIREIRAERNYLERIGGRATVYLGDVYQGVPLAPPSGPPMLRPASPQNFIGREEEIDRLIDELRPGKVVTVCGPGGIGKTALAAEAVWKLAPGDEPPETFPDGVVRHDFYVQPGVEAAFAHIAVSFGVQLQTKPYEAALQALAGKRALLVLDGTENADDLSTLLDIRGNCGVIVTSRSRGDAIGEPLDLMPLDPDEAIELLQAWGKERAADEEAAQRISELVGYLPLGVELAGKYLMSTRETAREYLDWLEETPLTALDHGERRLESIPVLLERSLAQVNDAARDALTVAGVLAFESFSRAVMDSALPETDIRGALGELVNYGLLVRPEERYQVTHQLIHTYVTTRHPASDEVIQRLTAYYTGYAVEQQERGLDGFAKLDLERPHIMRALAACRERKDWERAHDLVWAVDQYLDLRGYWIERRTAIEVGIQAARNLRDTRDEAAFLNNLGNVYYSLGPVDKAIEYYHKALAIQREIGNRRGEAIQLGGLGLSYNSLGQVQKAIGYYENALAMDKEIGYRQGEANQLGNLGIAYHSLGQVEKAIEYYDRALVIHREIGGQRGESQDLGNLGIAYYYLGQVEKALEHYKAALAIHREIGDRKGEANQLGNLGVVYRNLGQVEKAIEYYEAALAIHQQIGYRLGEANQLTNLGEDYRGLGEVEKAIEYLREALTIFEEIKSPTAEKVRGLLEELERISSPDKKDTGNG